MATPVQMPERMDEQVETLRVVEPETGWAAWTGRGLMAALEQGSVSGSNLVLSVALARWLTPAEYGVYAVAFSMLLLAAAMYQAMFLVPLMVYAPRLGRAQQAGYLRSMLRIQGWGSAGVLALAAVVCGAWAAYGDAATARLALASAFTAAALTFQWLLRDMHYSMLSPSAPARGSILYGLALVVALGAMSFSGGASAVTAITAMGFAALVSGVSQIPALRDRLRSPDPAVTAADVWREARKSGRWELWISISSWAPVHLTFAVTAGVLGPDMTGALRALQNFAMPLNQIMAALSRLALPYLCGRAGGGASPLLQGRRIAWVAIAAGMAYTAALWLIAGPAVHSLYGGAYDAYAWLMPLAILPMAFWGGAQALGLALRAAGRFPAVLIGALATGISFAGTVVPATRAFGIAGVLGSAVAAQLLGWGLLALLARSVETASAALSPMPADGGGA